MAAFADGDKSDLERAQIKRIVESFPNGDTEAVRVYQRVLQNR